VLQQQLQVKPLQHFTNTFPGEKQVLTKLEVGSILLFLAQSGSSVWKEHLNLSSLVPVSRQETAR
jgi:hypothetical protein